MQYLLILRANGKKTDFLSINLQISDEKSDFFGQGCILAYQFFYGYANFPPPLVQKWSAKKESRQQKSAARIFRKLKIDKKKKVGTLSARSILKRKIKKVSRFVVCRCKKYQGRYIFDDLHLPKRPQYRHLTNRTLPNQDSGQYMNVNKVG